MESPGRWHTALAGAKWKLPGWRHAPAVADVRTPERGRSYLTAEPPWRIPYCACWGRWGVLPGRLRALVVAGARTPGRDDGH